MDFVVYLIKYLRIADSKEVWYIGTVSLLNWLDGYIGCSCVVIPEGVRGMYTKEGWEVLSRQIICYCYEDERLFYENYYINYFCERYDIADDVPEMQCRSNLFCSQYKSGGLMINQQDFFIKSNKGLTRGKADHIDKWIAMSKSNILHRHQMDTINARTPERKEEISRNISNGLNEMYSHMSSDERKTKYNSASEEKSRRQSETLKNKSDEEWKHTMLLREINRNNKSDEEREITHLNKVKGGVKCKETYDSKSQDDKDKIVHASRESQIKRNFYVDGEGPFSLSSERHLFDPNNDHGDPGSYWRHNDRPNYFVYKRHEYKHIDYGKLSTDIH